MKKTLLFQRIYFIFFLLLFFFVALTSCITEEIDIDISERDIKVIGHGGMGIGQVYPMNSYESVMYAVSLGSDGIEIDVQMTKDGVLVAFHDEELETKTDKHGKIYEQNWDDIKDAEYVSSAPYTKYRIIRLKNIFEHLPNLYDYTFFLDVKSFHSTTSMAYHNQLNQALTNLIDEYREKRNLNINRIYIELKDEEAIELLQNTHPNYQIFAYDNFERALEKARKYKLKGITVQTSELTKENVELAQNEGLLVATLNTHSQNKNIEAVNKGVDYIQTDRVKHLIKILK
ncbi:glycerophosphodiester phosphodiesterase [Bernardetia sp.]|uniref:glycerophosphodiester phosphodiesterase n=1 Tax=Bernardetia sp. TaxID=1937974 RepID=UPI0025BEE939|nr:glycerophosphodiester phosphodiesterase family protein [Bernardetia sp.]